ncbi:WD40-repeat-containing domain protein [Leucosporidium creatinivorum]|uniref:WD40-repeat-containing domain protein n=1 Tax=Leucosporidium creatinivorum TaxID=106004 RepID=A0A1Y2C6R3_9BASI|nr:WD40-repeat-containing domain protein [Leucosporidium creatinivorum]
MERGREARRALLISYVFLGLSLLSSQFATVAPSTPSTNALGKRRATAFNDPLAHPARRTAGSALSSRYAAGFPHHTSLKAHESCVNALSCSNGNGKYLASGGDDKVVQLWSILGDLGGEQKPVARYRGARANVFSISFDCDNRKLYSTGADATILMHDLETASTSSTGPSGAPTDVWIDHDDSVHAVRCHPTDPHLFMTASEDGTVLSFDTRSEGRAVGILAERTEMNDVVYHPLQPTQFATADADGRVLLHDSRMAFGGSSTQGQLASEVAVLKYCTDLLKPLAPAEPNPLLPSTEITTFLPAAPSSSSITFSPTGNLICATMSQFFPTLFELSSPEPLATLSSPRTEGKGYRNTTTTKHGSFGDSGDKLWYAAGSDDFNAYVWEVPTLEAMKEGRRAPGTEAKDWFNGDVPSVSFDTRTESFPDFTIPVSLSTPSHILSTHRSIVNTALFHPSLPLLFTSGIEKLVVVHSPTPFSTPSPPFIPRKPRPNKAGLDTRDEDEEDRLGLGEDTAALEYFDALLEDNDGREDALWRDGHGRGWMGEDDDEEEESRNAWEEFDDFDSGEEWSDVEQDSDSGLDDAELEELMGFGRSIGRRARG